MTPLWDILAVFGFMPMIPLAGSVPTRYAGEGAPVMEGAAIASMAPALRSSISMIRSWLEHYGISTGQSIHRPSPRLI